MKDKPSEWIAISDLMSSVLAVVILLLVLSVLQKSASEVSFQEKLNAKTAEARIAEENSAKLKAQVSKSDTNNTVNIGLIPGIMNQLGSILNSNDDSGAISIDHKENKLVLKDGIFERGSACITSAARVAMESVQANIDKFLLNNQNARVFIEGYTDNIPVKHPVTDYKRYCTVYDDNFTLSAARAREARRFLIGTLNSAAEHRVVVAGFGDSKPLPDISPSDAKNRRVEVLFLLIGNN